MFYIMAAELDINVGKAICFKLRSERKANMRNHSPSENIFFRCEPYIVFKEHHKVDRDVGDAILLEGIGFV